MTTPTAKKLAVVPQIGRYHVIAELARGGMGDVYLAASQGPGGFSKLHAIKELKPSFCDDEMYVTMFLEEARLAARLIHPNIVQTNEVGSDGRRHFMVMEFLEGRSLHRIAKRFKEEFPANAYLRVIAEALLGLHYAHELRGFEGEVLGIVHRDVSPLNVFVTFNGQAKVIDFGIAKTAHSALDTRTGILKGRIAYMAPEQANGAKVDRRADIYSAGVMIWEALAGRRLWPQMSEADILNRLVREPAPRLRSVQPRAPEELNRICARAMAHRREDRYSSAGELAGDLEHYLARCGDAMTMREIGAVVGGGFGEERRKMNHVIEETLARVPRATSSGVMPKFRTPGIVARTNGDDVVDASAAPTRPLFTPSNSFGPQSGNSQSAPATAASLGGATGANIGSAASRRAAATVAAGVLLLGVLLFSAAWHRGRARAPVAPIAGATNVAFVSPSIPEAPSTSNVVVTASPKGAQIYDTLEPARPSPAVRRAPPVQVNQPPSQKPNCQPPYVVDLRTGMKRWRLECL